MVVRRKKPTTIGERSVADREYGRNFTVSAGNMIKRFVLPMVLIAPALAPGMYTLKTAFWFGKPSGQITQIVEKDSPITNPEDVHVVLHTPGIPTAQ
jgi:hypothetical protein